MSNRLFGNTYYRLHINGAATSIAPAEASRYKFENNQILAPAHRHYPTQEKDLTSPDTLSQETLERHGRHKDLVEPALCYRGDSRFPWKIWETGGLLAKGKGTGGFNVELHQSCPSTRQDVVSTSNNPETGRKYATAQGLSDDRYFPSLENYPRDQSDATWIMKQGYNHALWIEDGISLKQATRNNSSSASPAYGRNKYDWEDEVAVLEGIHRSRILATREIKDVSKTWELTPVYQTTAYVDRRLVLGKAHELGDQRAVLEKVFENLLDLPPEATTVVLKNMETQIKDSAATCIQHAWRARRKHP